MNGKIIKGIAGFYMVSCGGAVYTCRARGIFRREGLKPLVGDLVRFEMAETSDSESNIEEIYPRKNELIRPAVSNVDLALIVLAVKKPDPQLYLLDKYLVSMAQRNIPAAILWNKIDLDEEDVLPEYAGIYDRAGYRTMFSSTVDKRGISGLKEFLKGKTTVLAGPSGAGKSTLTNLICPEANMVTGDISRKIERGKQTTRHSELFRLGGETYLCDTPGFTSVFLENSTEDDIRFFFPEIGRLEGACHYSGCRHLSEPGCAVREAAANGTISASRYESYRKIMSEIKEKRKY